MVLVIDNYDSFVHNLARYVRQLGCQTHVVRNNQITIEQIRLLNPEAIILSPGPCTPNEAGICLDIVSELATEFPILGICLGHQVIIQALGGSVVSAIEPVHGRSSSVFHSKTPMFQYIDSPFTAGRYHSLIGSPSSLPDVLVATAFTDDRTMMAVEHKSLPIVGLQFHPESILTKSGYQLLENFFQIARLSRDDHSAAKSISELDATRFNGTMDEAERPYPMSSRLSKKELP